MGEYKAMDPGTTTAKRGKGHYFALDPKTPGQKECEGNFTRSEGIGQK
jgi:hypothetical protein